MNICVAFEAVPSLVIRHVFQPEVHLLPRLTASLRFGFCQGSLLLLLFLLPFFSSSESSSSSLGSAPDSVSVSATRISLMASSLSLIFSPAIARNLRWSALFRLLSMSGHGCRNLMSRRYELLQWQQNRSNATMWLQYKIQGCRRCFQ